VQVDAFDQDGDRRNDNQPGTAHLRREAPIIETGNESWRFKNRA
jgi:hypothetical protein